MPTDDAEIGAAAAEEEDELETGGAGAAPFVPQPVIGLSPGKAERTPVISSLTADTMLHEVEASLTPPMRPGHWSIPESPASQLSMICWRVGMSQPATCHDNQHILFHAFTR